MSYRKTLVHLLDRPGARFLLSKIATHAVRRAGGDGVEIAYIDGFWTRRVGQDFFPDSVRFEYRFADFGAWKNQMQQYEAHAKEIWLIHYLPRFGDVVVDVGAGHGEDVVMFSKAVGETGRVIAIEAHPLSFAILKKFCRLNKLANVIPLHLALMDKPGTVRVAESQSNWSENAVDGSGSSTTEVPAATLDNVCLAHGVTQINFLKMNIEGAERYALLGMKTMMPKIEEICVACHDFRAEMGHGEQFRTRKFVEQFLAGQGFTLTSRTDDQRNYVRDHIFGLRQPQGRPN